MVHQIECLKKDSIRKKIQEMFCEDPFVNVMKI